MITYPEAKYLKAVGNSMDVKVTIKPTRMIYIRDNEFYSFRKALTCLQHITEMEVLAPSEEMVS